MTPSQFKDVKNLDHSETPTIPAKILLVDDRKENLHALESLLRNETTDILKASSAREALELLLIHEFALAILDVEMPEINGFELAQLMRGSEKTKQVPIIFVTAGAIDPKYTFQGYEAGAVDFLYKPLDPKMVKSKVKVFLRLEEQRLLIQSQMKQLSQALSVREEFLSIASHELKTPLTSLSLHLQMARRGFKPEQGIAPTPEKLTKVFDTTITQVEKLTRMIDDLLDISRIRAGKLVIEPEKTLMAQIVRNVFERLEEQLEMAKCPVSLYLDDSLIVPCDQFRVEQVLTNLISNVIRYAPASHVEVSLKRENEFAILSVRDHGSGIPEDKINHIFDRFERASSEKSVRGLGLGLYIVKQIMRAHHGSIQVESKAQEGSTFTARFPLI